MSDLQISLLAVGALVVVGVYGFNVWQQRRMRRDTEQAFRDRPEDTLFTPGGAPAPGGERIEPTLRVADAPAEPQAAPVPGVDDKAGQALPDPDIDYVAEIRPTQPVKAEGLAQAMSRRVEFGKPVRWFGQQAASGRWQELQPGATGMYAAFFGALQLADRSGPATTLKLSEFRDLAHGLARSLEAEAECPDPDAAQARATRLDALCAEVDVMMVVNAVSRDGAAFPGTKLRALAEASGFRLEPDGVFRYHDEEGEHLFSLCNQEDAPFFPDAVKTLSTRGVTFFLEVPRVTDGARAFDAMVSIARSFCGTLGAMLVDDKRVPLNDMGIERIRGQLRAIAARMESQGIPPGGPRALRLFS
ncbi:MAG TPA: cell division protein ZipA C-terminal FtsZ-binding domain-containing protein [Burkholderiales bacterium]|nr:cell division protein ZipA C-terminal FtsZ-binding domain-containing protein [Burkholderiales bacterium]